MQIPGFAEMQEELIRLEAVVAPRLTDRSGLGERFASLKGLLTRGAANEELADLASKVAQDAEDASDAPEKDAPDVDVQAN